MSVEGWERVSQNVNRPMAATSTRPLPPTGPVPVRQVPPPSKAPPPPTQQPPAPQFEFAIPLDLPEPKRVCMEEPQAEGDRDERRKAHIQKVMTMAESELDSFRNGVTGFAKVISDFQRAGPVAFSEQVPLLDDQEEKVQDARDAAQTHFSALQRNADKTKRFRDWVLQKLDGYESEFATYDSRWRYWTGLRVELSKGGSLVQGPHGSVILQKNVNNCPQRDNLYDKMKPGGAPDTNEAELNCEPSQQERSSSTNGAIKKQALVPDPATTSTRLEKTSAAPMFEKPTEMGEDEEGAHFSVVKAKPRTAKPRSGEQLSGSTAGGSVVQQNSNSIICRDTRDICGDHRYGMCFRGDRCKYSHDLQQGQMTTELCGDYKRGMCFRGALCRYSHDLSGTGTSNIYTNMGPPSTVARAPGGPAQHAQQQQQQPTSSVVAQNNHLNTKGAATLSGAVNSNRVGYAIPPGGTMQKTTTPSPTTTTSNVQRSGGQYQHPPVGGVISATTNNISTAPLSGQNINHQHYPDKTVAGPGRPITTNTASTAKSGISNNNSPEQNLVEAMCNILRTSSLAGPKKEMWSSRFGEWDSYKEWKRKCGGKTLLKICRAHPDRFRVLEVTSTGQIKVQLVQQAASSPTGPGGGTNNNNYNYGASRASFGASDHHDLHNNQGGSSSYQGGSTLQALQQITQSAGGNMAGGGGPDGLVLGGHLPQKPCWGPPNLQIHGANPQNQFQTTNHGATPINSSLAALNLSYAEMLRVGGGDDLGPPAGPSDHGAQDHVVGSQQQVVEKSTSSTTWAAKIATKDTTTTGRDYFSSDDVGYNTSEQGGHTFGNYSTKNHFSEDAGNMNKYHQGEGEYKNSASDYQQIAHGTTARGGSPADTTDNSIYGHNYPRVAQTHEMNHHLKGEQPAFFQELLDGRLRFFDLTIEQAEVFLKTQMYLDRRVQGKLFLYKKNSSSSTSSYDAGDDSYPGEKMDRKAFLHLMLDESSGPCQAALHRLSLRDWGLHCRSDITLAQAFLLQKIKFGNTQCSTANNSSGSAGATSTTSNAAPSAGGPDDLRAMVTLVEEAVVSAALKDDDSKWFLQTLLRDILKGSFPIKVPRGGRSPSSRDALVVDQYALLDNEDYRFRVYVLACSFNALPRKEARSFVKSVQSQYRSSLQFEFKNMLDRANAATTSYARKCALENLSTAGALQDDRRLNFDSSVYRDCVAWSRCLGDAMTQTENIKDLGQALQTWANEAGDLRKNALNAYLRVADALGDVQDSFVSAKRFREIDPESDDDIDTWHC